MKETEVQDQETAQEFSIFLDEELKKVKGSEKKFISFTYNKDRMSLIEKQAMTIALIFWEFLRKLSVKAVYCSDERKLKFIADFLKNNPMAKENHHMKTVAMIEALPTSIWRKILWRENIDFSDYEPCLRRLNLEQEKAIEENYDDLYS